jgi:prophage antirepressor-like protein
MQGFLFSKPLPADELERWIAQTVLPRKAPWITQADGSQDVVRGQR